MIKLVAIDLDGTLFDKKKNVSNENIKAIKKCKENGIKIVIATGRPISGVLPLLELRSLMLAQIKSYFLQQLQVVIQKKYIKNH